MKSLADSSVRQSVVDRIARIRPESRPLWGRMSAHQMLCHVADTFRSVLGEKECSPATGVLQRTLIKWGALYLPIPWPKNVPTRPEVEQGAGGTPPTDFERDRADLLLLLQRFCAPAGGVRMSPHPAFGEMGVSDWQRWGYLHTDHHLRQFGV
jgi:hypothetical protein